MLTHDCGDAVPRPARRRLDRRREHADHVPDPHRHPAWVEDVIVDEASNNQGIGRLLLDAMVERARQLGAKTIDLTSRPSREAANHLYRKAGFEVRDTNVYRIDLGT